MPSLERGASTGSVLSIGSASSGGKQSSYQSKYGYTPHARKYIRPGLEQRSEAPTPGSEPGATPMSDGLGLGGDSEDFAQVSRTSNFSDGPSQRGLEQAFAATLTSGSAAATSTPPVPEVTNPALPAEGEELFLPVETLDFEMLDKVKMPPPGKYTRTAFDLNLDGVDGQPWVGQNPKAFFNYQLDEVKWRRYSRRQREIRIGLKAFTKRDGTLDKEALTAAKNKEKNRQVIFKVPLAEAVAQAVIATETLIKQRVFSDAGLSAADQENEEAEVVKRQHQLIYDSVRHRLRGGKGLPKARSPDKWTDSEKLRAKRLAFEPAREWGGARPGKAFKLGVMGLVRMPTHAQPCFSSLFPSFPFLSFRWSRTATLPPS